jgi:hemerythrin-like domain-containing protein
MPAKYILPYSYIKEKLHGIEYYNFLFSEKIDRSADHPVRRYLSTYTDDHKHVWEEKSGLNLVTISIGDIVKTNIPSVGAFKAVQTLIKQKYPDVELREVKNDGEARTIFQQNALAKLGIDKKHGGIGI